MGHYILYLDESETFTSTMDRYFAIGGVIVPDTIKNQLVQDINTLKSRLWGPMATQNILHEKEISEALHKRLSVTSPYSIFKNKANIVTLYNGLSVILSKYHIVTIGACLNESEIERLYGKEVSPKLTIALQLLLENYCHFLMTHNATGDICYESLQEPGNRGLRQRFYELEALGTMYYPPHFFQTHIGDIQFKEKTSNDPGLQLADFIPNTLARVAAGLKPKHNIFKKQVVRQLYDGGMNNTEKFGGKVMP